MGAAELRERLGLAVARRQAEPALARPDGAVRLVHDRADGLDGLVVERFGHVLTVQVFEGRFASDEDVLRAALAEQAPELGVRAIYRKFFPRDRSGSLPKLEAGLRDAQPWWGEPAAAEVEVDEGGLRLIVRPYDGYSVGLFLEQRDNRALVRRLGAGRRVLNLFAYTCGFSVAAAAGGAAEVASVDTAKRFLEWGKQNFAANGLSLDNHRFYCDDVGNFFRRAERQGRTYDLVIADPPTFGRARQGGAAFVLERDLPELVVGALDRIAPGGALLLAVNHRPTRAQDLVRLVRDLGGERGVRRVEVLPLPEDFVGDAAFSKSILVELA